MIDRRFPNLRRLTERWHIGVAREVQRRTGLDCAYDLIHDALYFHLPNDISVGVARRDAKVKLDSRDIDDLCRVIFLGRMSESAKERILRNQEAARKSEERERDRREFEEVRPEAEAFAKRFKNRAGMGKHYRPMVTVPGRDGGKT